MLVYIIDGFNVIHKIPTLKSSSNPWQDLISYIKQKKLTGSKNNKVCIVFDGSPRTDALRERQFQILFSCERDADDVIKERIQKAKNKRQIVLVSDDREIRDFAKAQGANLLSVADFLKVKQKQKKEPSKDISYSLQREITEELRKIWLKE
ncbi:MAG: NYN domain-containing protein [Candidatus Omnitrophota bacterium]|nr:MAG: NYN domain-containing protein [Candidatus Omnitrophota bacterium]